MVREIIVPTHQEHTVHIPKEYLQKHVEILILPYDTDKKSVTKQTDDAIFSQTAGILSDQNIDPVKWQRTIRSEWDR